MEEEILLVVFNGLGGWFQELRNKKRVRKKKRSRAKRGERGTKFFCSYENEHVQRLPPPPMAATRSNAVDRLPRQVVSISLRRMYTNFIKVSKHK